MSALPFLAFKKEGHRILLDPVNRLLLNCSHEEDVDFLDEVLKDAKDVDEIHRILELEHDWVYYELDIP